MYGFMLPNLNIPAPPTKTPDPAALAPESRFSVTWASVCPCSVEPTHDAQWSQSWHGQDEPPTVSCPFDPVPVAA